jgi:holo-[acyl-carrier protein] synthase
MILGIGHDMVDMQRLKATLAEFGQQFLDRTFTKTEQARAVQKQDPLPTYARRWAAKEACAKALGTGIGAQAGLTEIGLENSENGQPKLVLTGAAEQRLAALTPIGHKARVHVSLSDEFPYASAFVILEALPEEKP